MPKTLNFNKMQKPSLRIELADEKHTTIFVMPPTKGEIEAFGEISTKLGGNKLDEAIEMCAKLMSHNIAKIPIICWKSKTQKTSAPLLSTAG